MCCYRLCISLIRRSICHNDFISSTECSHLHVHKCISVCSQSAVGWCSMLVPLMYIPETRKNDSKRQLNTSIFLTANGHTGHAKNFFVRRPPTVADVGHRRRPDVGQRHAAAVSWYVGGRRKCRRRAYVGHDHRTRRRGPTRRLEGGHCCTTWSNGGRSTPALARRKCDVGLLVGNRLSLWFRVCYTIWQINHLDGT